MNKKLIAAIENYQQIPDKGKMRKSLWLKNFYELIRYKAKFGNTNVSCRSNDYKSLGIC